MCQDFNHQITLTSKINKFLILFLPITLLVGSLVSNLTIVLICILFIIELIQKKNFYLFKDFNFKFLLIIYFYLILNSFFISENSQSVIKALSFIRFFILAYALNYYFKIYKKNFLKFWSLTFLVVSFDIIFEFIFSYNILGIQSNYPGRIASFLGEELKIGGFYFGFIFLVLSLFYEKNKKIFIILSLTFFVISLLIGERSNFFKIVSMYLLFFCFFTELKIYKKILFLITLVSVFLLVIFNNPIFKGRYLNQVFNTKLINEIKSENTDFFKIIKSNRHLRHYYIATQIFKENVLFGTGFKSFRIESYKNKYLELNGSSTHPHQTHFEILSELGIVGYILILSNVIYVLFKQRKTKKVLVQSAMLFVIATFIPILPSGSFFTSYNSTIFFINYSFLLRNRINQL